MLFSDYTTAMLSMLAANDANGTALFTTIQPRMIEYAELRIYRSLDFLTTVTTNVQACTPSNRNLVIPTGTFVVVERANLITPAATAPDSGKRTPLSPVSEEFLDTVAGDVTTAGPPLYWCLRSDTAVLLGPWPDQAYNVEFSGTQRPAPLSAVNTSTFISTYLPDLMISASMIFGAGYQKNFGAQADDPKMALSWEGIFQEQLKQADLEELRKKHEAGNWQAYMPSPVAVPKPS